MFRKRCDLFREQNQPLIEQKLPTSGSSKSGEEMSCFLNRDGIQVGFTMSTFCARFRTNALLSLYLSGQSCTLSSV